MAGNKKKINQQWAIRYYVWPVVNDNSYGIAHKTIGTNNFEPKPTLISMVLKNQFGGEESPLEDPILYLATFFFGDLWYYKDEWCYWKHYQTMVVSFLFGG